MTAKDNEIEFLRHRCKALEEEVERLRECIHENDQSKNSSYERNKI